MNEQRLTFIRPAATRRSPGGKALGYGVYRCSCGQEVERRNQHVTSGRTQSCGCLYRELMGRDLHIHGETGTPLHAAWQAMRRRCTPTVSTLYPTYQGVKCDPRWETFEGFSGNQPPGRPFEPGLALSRIGDTGDYSPENCRWITRAENTREMNERRMLRLSDGRFAADVARERGISQKTWRTRYYRGWSIDDAVSIAPRHGVRPSA